jgi:hypothetical protein
MPGMPGMAHNPFANFHTQFTGSGNVPVFDMNDAQRQYMQMMTQQQEAMRQQAEQMNKMYQQVGEVEEEGRGEG